MKKLVVLALCLMTCTELITSAQANVSANAYITPTGAYAEICNFYGHNVKCSVNVTGHWGKRLSDSKRNRNIKIRSGQCHKGVKVTNNGYPFDRASANADCKF